MSTEFFCVRDSASLDRFNNPLRKSFFIEEEKDEGKDDKNPKVLYAYRYKCRNIKPIRGVFEVEDNVLVFVEKKPCLVDVLLLETGLKFVGWVGETPSDSPILEFFLKNGVLKARILYRQWWRLNRVTTAFRPVKYDIGNETVPTLFDEAGFSEDEW